MPLESVREYCLLSRGLNTKFSVDCTQGFALWFANLSFSLDFLNRGPQNTINVHAYTGREKGVKPVFPYSK